MPGPIGVFVCSFCFGALAGLVRFLQGNAEFVWRPFAASVLGGALMSMSVTMALWWKLGDSEPDIIMLLGISILLPLGGVTAFDIVPAVKGWLVKILKNGNGGPHANGNGAAAS